VARDRTKPDRPPDPAAVAAAVYANSFRTVEPRIAATGFRTNALRQDGGRHGVDPDPAGEFLANSRLLRRDAEFDTSVSAFFTGWGAAVVSLLDLGGRRGLPEIRLPEPLALPMTFGETFRRRRSVRLYTGDAMPLQYLGTILHAACGVTGELPTADGASVAVRSTPSAGALYPVEVHVVALQVDGLRAGTFVYDARGHRLWDTGGTEQVEGVLAALAAPDEVIAAREACAIFLLVARPWRSMRKYGARGLRHVFLEAGAIAEHVNLASVALGLGSVDCSGVYDDEVDDVLGLDGFHETLVHVVVVGTPG
jgi:SagB-type dehydrogenase family enzyme